MNTNRRALLRGDPESSPAQASPHAAPTSRKTSAQTLITQRRSCHRGRHDRPPPQLQHLSLDWGLPVGVNAEPTLEAAPPALILITEKEVVLSTAAAVPVRPTTMRWWPRATRVVLAAMHRMFLTSTPDHHQPPRHYPRRYGFLERSCLEREMDRL
jgi:hypothetical protein